MNEYQVPERIATIASRVCEDIRALTEYVNALPSDFIPLAGGVNIGRIEWSDLGLGNVSTGIGNLDDAVERVRDARMHLYCAARSTERARDARLEAVSDASR